MSSQRTARDTDINTFMGTEMNPYLVNMPTKMFGSIFGHSEKNGYNPKDVAKSQQKLEEAAQKAIVVVNKGKKEVSARMARDKAKYEASKGIVDGLNDQSDRYARVLNHVKPQPTEDGGDDNEDGN